MTDFMKIEGLKELNKKLGQLAPNIERKVLAKSVTEGARIVRDEAKRLVPIKTGTLKRGIKYRRKPRQPRGSVVYQVGLAPKAFYGMFVEFGTKKLAARPFLRPAFDGKISEAIAAMKQKMWAGILNETKK